MEAGDGVQRLAVGPLLLSDVAGQGRQDLRAAEGGAGGIGTRVLRSLTALLPPAPETGDRRKGHEVLQMRELCPDLFDDLLDQEVSEGDPGQALQRIVDGVEDGGVRLGGADGLLRPEDRADLGRDPLDQRHLHEDERNVAGGRMEEGVAAAVLRGESALELLTVGHRVDLLEAQHVTVDLPRGVPGDLLQPQKAAVEPGGEQVVEVLVQRAQRGMLSHEAAQIGPHLHQGGRGIRGVVDPAQQLLTGGLGRGEQLGLLSVAGTAAPGLEGGGEGLRVHAVFLQQVLEELHAAGVVELLIGAEHPRPHGPAGGFSDAAHEHCTGRTQLLERGNLGRLLVRLRAAADAEPAEEIAEQPDLAVSHRPSCVYMTACVVYNSRGHL